MGGPFHAMWPFLTLGITMMANPGVRTDQCFEQIHETDHSLLHRLSSSLNHEYALPGISHIPSVFCDTPIQQTTELTQIIPGADYVTTGLMLNAVSTIYKRTVIFADFADGKTDTGEQCEGIAQLHQWCRAFRHRPGSRFFFFAFEFLENSLGGGVY